MAAISNILNSVNADNRDLVGEWMPGIFVKQGRSAGLGSVLYGFFAKLRVQKALNGVFNSFERDPVRSNFYTNAAAGYAGGITQIAFDDGNGNPVVDLLAKGTILMNNRTLEYIRVSADPTTSLATTLVDVVRNCFIGGVGAAINDNDVWSRITEGALEGANPRRAAYEQPNVVTNFIQTLKSSVYLSNYYDANQVRSNMEGPRKDATNYSLEQIVNQIEKALLVGQRAAGTASMEQLTGGITWAIDQAIAANTALTGIRLDGLGATTGVTIDAVVGWLENFMNNGSEAKLAICGDKAYSALSKYALGPNNGFRVINSDNNDKIGLAIKEIETPAGTLSLCRHPLLMKDEGFRKHMIVVDLGLVALKVMEKLHFQEFEPQNGTDAYQGQFRTKVGLQMNFAEAFGYAYNFSKVIP